MALIECPECTKMVSDKATQCMNCGVSIANAAESSAAGARLTTTQSTSKKLKAHTMLAVLVFLAGLSLQFSLPETAPEDPGPIWPAAMMAIGLIWYVVTRARIWWHHN